MKKLILSVSLISLIAVGITLFSHKQNITAQYIPDNISSMIVYDYGFSGAAQYEYERKANLETGRIDVKDVEKAKLQVKELSQKKSSLGLNWTFAGPTNIGGRCRAILVDKDNPSKLYVGGVSGGLWVSTTSGGSWQQIVYDGDEETGGIPNLNISSICQATNGDIYFGTGEYFANPYGSGNSGFQGAGIWKSTDGENFYRLSSTWSDTQSKQTFVFVNKLVAHPTDENTIYAATINGLQVTHDGGETWTNPVIDNGNPVTEPCGDVKISSDGEYIIVDLGFRAFVSHNSGATDSWTLVAGQSSENLLPLNSIRTEFDIAPANRNIMYAQTTKSNRSLLNIYRSEDGGLTWSIIGPGGSADFNPLGSQGDYDNVIAVFPDNPNEIMVGGQYSLWHWEISQGWEQLTYWNLPTSSSIYVHADQHEITFNPNNPDIVYVGSDGGIHRSLDRGQSWVTLNKNFGVTQFYGIAHSGTGQLLGGTQDNGTLYIDTETTTSTGTAYEAVEVTGGDGGYSEISQIDENIMFSTLYYSSLFRSEERGENMQEGYGARVYSLMDPGNDERGHPFVTPIALWESFNDPYSTSEIVFVADRDYQAGEVLYIESHVKEKYIRHQLEQDLAEEEELVVIDHYQSQMAAGFRGGLWVTRDALNFRKVPIWVPVANLADSSIVETVNVIEWSKDGNILYVGINYSTSSSMSGRLYRIKGFNENRVDTLMDITRNGYNLEQSCIAVFPWRTITGIGVDPEVSGNVVITLGNYGNTDYVYYSTNANVAPNITSGTGTFTSKQGDLPQMPVYDAEILWNDSRKVIIGTEYGIFATTDITASAPSWTDENNGMDYVPTFHLRQQTHKNGFINEIAIDSKVENHGYIWAGTHGRGIFMCNDFAGPVSVEEIENDIADSQLKLFPNPASDYLNINFEMEKSGMVNINIFDIQGKLIIAAEYNLGKGNHHKMINLSKFESGMYIINAKINGQNVSEQFIVQ